MSGITPTTMSLNFSHMYDFTDRRPSSIPPNRYNPNSLMYIIDNNPDFSKFSYVIKLARLDLIYNDIQANFTVFVPSNRGMEQILPEGVFTNLDISSARQIVQASTLKKRITSDLLSDSPSTYFITMNPIEKLLITNISDITYINNCIQIIQTDIEACNGLIHVIDNIIWPTVMI
jgi:uncharacterized surface protein with fasciclin (FAS1) repeats